MGYFLHNIRYLFKHKMEDSLRESREETVDLVDQYYRYSLMNNNLSVDQLNVLSSIDTVKYLSKKHTSFCRFGDGEIEIIMGKSIPFQKYDKKLAYLLKKILQSSKDNIEIGVPYVYFHEFEHVNECAKHFMIYGAPRYRKLLLECCDKNKLFIDASFTQNYMASADVKSFFEYYRAIKKMFCEKNLYYS